MVNRDDSGPEALPSDGVGNESSRGSDVQTAAVGKVPPKPTRKPTQEDSPRTPFKRPRKNAAQQVQLYQVKRSFDSVNARAASSAARSSAGRPTAASDRRVPWTALESTFNRPRQRRAVSNSKTFKFEFDSGSPAYQANRRWTESNLVCNSRSRGPAVFPVCSKHFSFSQPVS